MKAKHVVVMLSHNSAPYIKGALKSLLLQKFRPLGFVLIDGASTDATNSIIENTIPQLEAEGIEVYYERTPTNLGQIGSYIYVHRNILGDKPETIVARLDSDDMFIDSNSLSIFFSEKYWEPDIGFVWSNFVYSHGVVGFCKDVPPDAGSVSEFTRSPTNIDKNWIFSLMHGWRVGVFNAIPEWRLQMSNGEYFVFAVDRVIVYSILELLGFDRIKFIPRILYVYTRKRPGSVTVKLGDDYYFKVERPQLISMKPLERIEGRFWEKS